MFEDEDPLGGVGPEEGGHHGGPGRPAGDAQGRHLACVPLVGLGGFHQLFQHGRTPAQFDAPDP